MARSDDDESGPVRIPILVLSLPRSLPIEVGKNVIRLGAKLIMMTKLVDELNLLRVSEQGTGIQTRTRPYFRPT